MNTHSYFIFLLSLAILSACQNKPEKPDLRGHWHVYFPDSMFLTWDILDNTRMIVDKNSYSDYYSYSISEPHYYGIWEADTMIGGLPYTHNVEFKYELSNDTLYLKDVEYVPINDTTDLYYTGKTLTYGVRVDTNTCNLAKEYYGHVQININLPTSQEVVGLNKILLDNSLFSSIDIGHPKGHLKEYPKDTFLLQVHDVFISHHSVAEYIEQELAKLPEVQRDSVIILMGVDRSTPVMVVDSVEQSIHASYPTVDIYYACLPEKQVKMHKSIFTSLKNEFAKPVEKPADFLTFSVNEDKQVEWTVQKRNQKAESQRYDLQTAEGKDKLKETILQANQNKQPLGIRFHFTEGASFQDYITAQTTIKQILEQATD